MTPVSMTHILGSCREYGKFEYSNDEKLSRFNPKTAIELPFETLFTAGVAIYVLSLRNRGKSDD